ncbi:hypothetical protein JCM24511_06602 [Saitozyma sp. JCM 24511]|nr:hypothetical protein JCM24511_06602 [Saitozyma sp. JCM 24511]
MEDAQVTPTAIDLAAVAERTVITPPLTLGCSAEGAKDVPVVLGLLDRLKRTLAATVPSPSTRQGGIHDGLTVLITGATGALGAHTLGHLVEVPRIRRIVCPCRALSDVAAEQRVEESLLLRGVPSISTLRASGVAIECVKMGASQPGFGLDPERLLDLRSSVTTVIHMAWPVHWKLPLSGFVEILQTLRSLLAYFPSAQHFFISSIAAVLAATNACVIPESLDPDPRSAWLCYGQSKWIAEHLCAYAADLGIRCTVVRVGQLSGDTRHGRWNPYEAYPALLRSVAVLRILPSRELLGTHLQWLPIDHAAWCVATLASSSAGLFSYPASGRPRVNLINLVSKRPFSWASLLEHLAEPCNLGNTFRIVDYDVFLSRLRLADVRQCYAVRLYGAYAFWSAMQGSKGFASDRLQTTLIESLLARGVGKEKAKSEVGTRLAGVDGEGIARMIAAWRESGHLPPSTELKARL